MFLGNKLPRSDAHHINSWTDELLASLMHGRSRANKNRCSRKCVTFQNEIITEA